MKLLEALIARIRSLIYRAGFRPRQGSIWHSPSRDWQIQSRAVSEAVTDGIRQAQESIDAAKKGNTP